MEAIHGKKKHDSVSQDHTNTIRPQREMRDWRYQRFVPEIAGFTHSWSRSWRRSRAARCWAPWASRRFSTRTRSAGVWGLVCARTDMGRPSAYQLLYSWSLILFLLLFKLHVSHAVIQPLLCNNLICLMALVLIFCKSLGFLFNFSLCLSVCISQQSGVMCPGFFRPHDFNYRFACETEKQRKPYLIPIFSKLTDFLFIYF